MYKNLKFEQTTLYPLGEHCEHCECLTVKEGIDNIILTYNFFTFPNDGGSNL